MTLTVATRLAWRLAESEARRARWERIGTAQMFIGLCKVGNLMALEDWGGVTDEDRQSYLDEAAAIVDSFASIGLERVKLYRQLRRLVGVGAATQRDDEPISRDEPVKAAFRHASRLAGSASVTSLHLAVGLLQASSGLPDHLRRLRVDPEQLRSVLEARVGSHTQEGHTEFGRDLTALAAAGRFRSIAGRRAELLEIVRILSRSTKSNVLLLGEPGVGKTAVVEALACRIAAGKSLPGRRLVEVRTAELLAGATYRGEFEERLKRLVDEARRDPDLIVFVDEAHTLLRAGAVEGGALDAANALKPALGSGELRMIAATTPREYETYLSQDPAFQRRFRVVRIAEPTQQEAETVLRQLAPELEAQFGITVDASAIQAAVRLTSRYVRDRYLPDKAIDALDEACARVALPTLSVSDAARTHAAVVRGQHVAEVVRGWTAIPIDLSSEQLADVSALASTLKSFVIGQDDACDRVAEALGRMMTGVRDPNRPVGVFLLVGPTGVGKTELAKATATALFGSSDAITRIDMSEYADRFHITRLIGAPPGYVGHDEGGQLTDALRRQAFSVILLDEVEKAHPDVLKLFLQVFDEGRVTDGKGRTVDATNSVFFLTSNAVAAEAGDTLQGFRDVLLDERDADVALRLGLPSELVNRFDAVIPFGSLGFEDLCKISEILLREVAHRLQTSGINLEWDDDAVNTMVRQVSDPRLGARPLKRGIDRMILTPISRARIEDPTVHTFRFAVSGGQLAVAPSR